MTAPKSQQKRQAAKKFAVPRMPGMNTGCGCVYCDVEASKEAVQRIVLGEGILGGHNYLVRLWSDTTPSADIVRLNYKGAPKPRSGKRVRLVLEVVE